MENIILLICFGVLGLLLLGLFLYSIIKNAVKEGVIEGLAEYNKHKDERGIRNES